MGSRYGGRRFEVCPRCHDAVKWEERKPQTKCRCGAWLGVQLGDDDKTWTWTEVPAPKSSRPKQDHSSQLDILGRE